MCEIFQHPVVLGEARLLSCRCFTGCRLKERDKSNFSLCHVSDITFLFIYFLLSNFFISWRPITLQYCSGSCHTMVTITLYCLIFIVSIYQAKIESNNDLKIEPTLCNWGKKATDKT